MKPSTLGLVLLVVALLAAFEFFHEWGDDADTAGALICTNPATQRSSLGDWLLMHMQSHR